MDSQNAITEISNSRNRLMTRSDSIGPSRNQMSPKNEQKVILLPSIPFESSRSKSKNRRLAWRKLNYTCQKTNDENADVYRDRINDNIVNRTALKQYENYSSASDRKELSRQPSYKKKLNHVTSYEDLLKFESNKNNNDKKGIILKLNTNPYSNYPQIAHIDLGECDFSKMKPLSRIDINVKLYP